MSYVKPIIVVLLGVAILTTSCDVFGDKETHVIPKGFTGTVLILFNQNDGKPPKYENGRRVYEIPENGILRTQFGFNEGYHDLSRYFYADRDQLIEIPFVIEPKDVSPDRIQVCCLSSGQAAKTSTGPWVEYLQFFVGTKSQIHDAGAKREKLNPADFAK